MILFKEDIDKYRPMIHTNTTNKSFVRMSIVLGRRGIANRYFFLALHQPELEFVDPHSPDLTPEQQEMILAECKINPWYFFREVCRISESGNDPVKFNLHRGNLAAIWTFMNDIDFGLVQPRQSGKQTSNNEPVKVPGGWKRTGDIQVGDIVTAHDGTPAKVTGVFPQGMQPLYRITFIDGRYVDVGKEHLWTIIKPANRRGYTTAVVTTEEIMNRLERRSDFMTTFIPMNTSEQIPDVDLPLDPYLLGVLLGDGSIVNIHNFSITTDEEILDRVTPMIPEGSTMRRSMHRNGFTGIGNINRSSRDIKINPIGEIIRDLGLLGCTSYTKFIPEIYLNASHNQRMELLRGLMDTDGYAGKGNVHHGVQQSKGSHTEFSTSSERLAHDFQLLVRSIGAQCKIRSRIPYYTHKGERKAGAKNYRSYIRYPYMSDLFWLPRKKERMQDVNHNASDWKLRVMSVMPLGVEEECTCISIDHPDSLYITKDYIVTHNTYAIQALMWYYLGILADNVHVGMFTKDPILIHDNVGRLKQVRDSMPPWMVVRSNKDWDRKQGVSYMAKGNYYHTHGAPADEKYATKAGRGATYALTHFDEIAFLAYNWILVPAAVNSMIAASESARKAGLPSPSIYTTTAGNPDYKEGAFALNMFQSAASFSEELYDLKDRDDLVAHIKRSSENIMLYLEFSHYQLGKDDEWLNYVAKRSHSSQDDINRDLLNIWQANSDASVIPVALMSKIRQSKIEPTFVDLQDGFMVKWYVDRERVSTDAFRNEYLVMGMDTSENIGRDYTTFTIMDPRTMDTIATCRCNDSNSMQVARHITTLLTRYPSLIWIPERNNTGTALIDHVLEFLQSRNINPYTRIYNEVIQRRDDDKYAKIDIYDFQNIPGNIRSLFGYRTIGGNSGTSRNMLYKTTMMKALEMNHSRIKDNHIITELGTLHNKNGRIDHPAGCHDDTVISYLLASYLIFFGKNLKYYGIPDGVILDSLSTTGAAIDKTEYNRQMAIRRRISELETALGRVNGSMLVNVYRREIKELQRKLNKDIEYAQPIAIEQMKHDEKEVKRMSSANPMSNIRNFATKWRSAMHRHT